MSERLHLSESRREARQLVHCLLDAASDAFMPDSPLDRQVTGRCPTCGSRNVTESDGEGLADCFDCGLWFKALQEDELDYVKYAMQHGLPPRIVITFSRTTPESAEQGDFSETGWIDEEGESMEPDHWDRDEGITAVDKAAKFLWDEGAWHASSSHFHPGVWYSTESSTTDYQTGETEERSFHLKEFTPEQEQEVWNLFHGLKQKSRRQV